MKIIVPDYYPLFRCKADKCRHSCCIGWEIDIDDNTYELYKSMSGSLGEELKNNISEKDGIFSFILTKDERCPFLNGNGLCRLIIEKGEDALCDICSDHPRYRNYYSDRIEMGIGLCCEAAAELILKRQEKTAYILLYDDDQAEPFLTAEETHILEFKQVLTEIIQNREASIEERFAAAAKYAGVSCPEPSEEEIYRILYPLERLEKSWDDKLSALLSPHPEAEHLSDIVSEQLAVYFLNRHLPAAAESNDVSAHVLFSLFSTRAIAAVSACADVDVTEIARMYSSEIEYSDENTEKIMEILSDRKA